MALMLDEDETFASAIAGVPKVAELIAALPAEERFIPSAPFISASA